MYCVYPPCSTARIDSYSWTLLPSGDPFALFLNHSPLPSFLGIWRVSSCLLRRETLISTLLQNLVICRRQSAAHPATPAFQDQNRSGAPRLFSNLFQISMQARPRPSLDTNVSQYASRALQQPHLVDSGPSSSTAPSDSAVSTLVDPFASLCRDEDTRTADFASPLQEQASPALRSRSHSATSRESTISKNGVLYQEYYIAKYDYEPESSNYLPFSAGQLIKIIRKHSSGWWDGELAGRRGWFPSNYLYSDSSRLVRVRTDSLESVCIFFHPTLRFPFRKPSIPSPCPTYSTRLLVLTFLS